MAGFNAGHTEPLTVETDVHLNHTRCLGLGYLCLGGPSAFCFILIAGNVYALFARIGYRKDIERIALSSTNMDAFSIYKFKEAGEESQPWKLLIGHCSLHVVIFCMVPHLYPKAS